MMKTPTPKQRDSERTKAKILAVAQEAFATYGYSQTGIRDIAGKAEVSSPLVLRYFGSKPELFEVALTDLLGTDTLFSGNHDRFGATLASILADATREIKQPSMILLSVADPEARKIATRVVRKKVLNQLADWLGPPQSKERALEIIMLGMGFVLFTRQMPLLPRNKSSHQDMAQWLAETVQQVVDRV